MRDLETGGGDALDVILASDQAARVFEVVTAAAFNASEVGQEGGFPDFGTFLKCRQPSGDECWVELPQGLESQLAEMAEEKKADGGNLEGLVFLVDGIRKTANGSWRYSLEWYESFEEARDAL